MTHWSPFQEKIFASAEAGQNLVVQSGPGCGKTSMLVVIASRIKLQKPSSKVAVVAFNTDIVESLKRRVPNGVSVKTAHAYGLDVCRNNIARNLKIRDSKVLANELIPDNKITLDQLATKVKITNQRDVLARLITLFKASLDEVNEQTVATTLERFSIASAEDAKYFVPLLQNAVSRSIQISDSIELNDMIWLPVVFGWRQFEFDYILVDECQDLTNAQLKFLLLMGHSQTQYIGFGDPHQSVYNFRGVDAQSFDNFQHQFGAVREDLPISYRCARKIVEEAKKIVPSLQAAEKAEEGTCTFCTQEEALRRVQPGDLIICRNNTPLLDFYLKLRSIGVPAFIGGKLFAQYLRARAKIIAQSSKSFNGAVKDWFHQECSMFVGSKTGAFKYFQDAASFFMVLNNTLGIDQRKFEDEIHRIFNPTPNTVQLTTAHRAKGLEANQVFILQPNLFGDSQQEKNLRYIAITRAKKSLYYVTQ